MAVRSMQTCRPTTSWIENRNRRPDECDRMEIVDGGRKLSYASEASDAVRAPDEGITRSINIWILG